MCRCRCRSRGVLQPLGFDRVILHVTCGCSNQSCWLAMRGCSGHEDARLSNTQIIHNIPQVYHVPSPPKYVHVPVPGPKIHKVAGGRAAASAGEFL